MTAFLFFVWHLQSISFVECVKHNLGRVYTLVFWIFNRPWSTCPYHLWHCYFPLIVWHWANSRRLRIEMLEKCIFCWLKFIHCVVYAFWFLFWKPISNQKWSALLLFIYNSNNFDKHHNASKFTVGSKPKIYKNWPKCVSPRHKQWIFLRRMGVIVAFKFSIYSDFCPLSITFVWLIVSVNFIIARLISFVRPTLF